MAVAVGLAPGPARAGPPFTDWTTVARQVVPAVVNISVLSITTGEDGSRLGEREHEVGSGFIVDPNGTIVTNKHVIAGAFRITVTLNDGTELPAKLLAAAKMVDLAVLKIDAGHTLPVLQLAPADAVHAGDPVLALGNPLGVGTSLSAGIVSGINRNLMKSPFDDYVQTDAAINHGNSGGPLIDTKGEVIGVDTILLTNLPNEGSNGLGFAISSVVVGYVLHHLLDPTATHVGWIGTQLQDVTPDLARAFGMESPHGFLITDTDPGSPAQQAGLQPGDVILRYGTAADQPGDPRALLRMITMAPIDTPQTLTIWRDGQTLQIPVTVRPWPNMMEPHGSMMAAGGAILPLPSADLGMLLAPITPLAREQYSLGNLKGVLVVAIDRQSEAYGYGMDSGDVIERVQGIAVETPKEVYHLVKKAAARGGIVAVLMRTKERTRWIALHAQGDVDAEVSAMLEREHDASAPCTDHAQGCGAPRQPAMATQH